MTGNVHYLHGRPREIANFTRVGFSEHRQVEQFLSAGALSATRFAIEAANFKRQTSLIRTLRDEKAEIVLDSNVVELSTKGRFSGAMRFAPWAAADRPWTMTILSSVPIEASLNRSSVSRLTMVSEPSWHRRTISAMVRTGGFRSIKGPARRYAENWIAEAVKMLRWIVH